jgi:hypothetical protein
VNSHLLEWLAWSGYVVTAPLISVTISTVYFLASPHSQTLSSRLLASAHGLAVALLYVVAWITLISGHSNLRLSMPFAVSLFLPIVLMGISLFTYRGPKGLHWLQLVNVVCLVWIGFTGIMLITGESL